VFDCDSELWLTELIARSRAFWAVSTPAQTAARDMPQQAEGSVTAFSTALGVSLHVLAHGRWAPCIQFCNWNVHTSPGLLVRSAGALPSNPVSSRSHVCLSSRFVLLVSVLA
jgi:hypothetical protein